MPYSWRATLIVPFYGLNLPQIARLARFKSVWQGRESSRRLWVPHAPVLRVGILVLFRAEESEARYVEESTGARRYAAPCR